MRRWSIIFAFLLSISFPVLATAQTSTSPPDSSSKTEATTPPAEKTAETSSTEIRPEDVSIDKAVGLIERWVNSSKEWLIEHTPALLFKLVVFVGILAAFKVLSWIAGGIVMRALKTSRLKWSQLLKDFAISITKKGTFIAGLLIALSSIGVDITPILAGVGVFGFVVGFAMQETLSNFSAGVMILLYRPYDVGDVISAASVTGKVTSMSLVSTSVVTPDNQLLIVPNGKIWGDVITNVTAHDTRRVDLTVGISYDDDIAKAERVLLEIISAHPSVLKDPEPKIKLTTLGDSSVDFAVRPWCKTSDYWDVYWDLIREIKQRFDKEDLTFPYPQRELHVIQKSAS